MSISRTGLYCFQNSRNIQLQWKKIYSICWNRKEGETNHLVSSLLLARWREKKGPDNYHPNLALIWTRAPCLIAKLLMILFKSQKNCKPQTHASFYDTVCSTYDHHLFESRNIPYNWNTGSLFAVVGLGSENIIFMTNEDLQKAKTWPMQSADPWTMVSIINHEKPSMIRSYFGNIS